VKIISQPDLNDMTDAEVKSNWNTMKTKLHQKFTGLNNNEKMLLKDKKDEVITRLQIKLGISKEDLQKIIAGL
jgi:hypothetical protein